MMRFFFTKIVFLIISLSLLSSIGTQKIKAQIGEKKSFYNIKSDFNKKWESIISLKSEVPKGKGWKQYKRWENFMESRVYPSGKFTQ